MDQESLKNISILYIEDDAITREQVTLFLKPLCKVFYIAKDGREGLDLYGQFKPNIVITDIEMPRLNGLQLAKAIRKISLLTQIIIITAHKNSPYLLEAVNLQLVQYLLKPISLDRINHTLMLAAQIVEGNNKASALNGRVMKATQMITVDMHYNTYTKELVSKNKTIELSKYERALMELLIEKHPAPVAYESIDAHIYNYGASKNAMKLLVSSLREKVGKSSIINVSGFGYKLNPECDK